MGKNKNKKHTWSKSDGANSGAGMGSGRALGTSDAPAGFERIREGGDGNCLFHAIARQALGDTNLATQARLEICDWMESHLSQNAHQGGRSALSDAHRMMIAQQRAEIMSFSSCDDDEMQVYIRKMRRQGEWGTGLEALAAAYCYRRRVHVYSPGEHSELRPPPSILDSNAEDMRLLHNGRNHWDSAKPLCGRHVEDHPSPIRDDENVGLALALSASWLDANGTLQHNGKHGAVRPIPKASVVNEIPIIVQRDSNIADDERAMRRDIQMAAAEKRMQKDESRGLGTKGVAKIRQAQLLAQSASSSSTTATSSASTPAASSSASTLSCSSAVDQARGSSTLGKNRWNRRTNVEADAGNSASRTTAPILVLRQDPCIQTDDGLSTSCREGIDFLVSVGMSQAEAVDVWESCGGDLEHVKRTYRFDSDADQSTLRLQQPMLTSVSEMEECIAALARIGFSHSEAADIVQNCDGDVAQVKALYGIDWDADGKTLQNPFVAD